MRAVYALSGEEVQQLTEGNKYLTIIFESDKKILSVCPTDKNKNIIDLKSALHLKPINES